MPRMSWRVFTVIDGDEELIDDREAGKIHAYINVVTFFARLVQQERVRGPGGLAIR